jgi:hypothetical protein
MQFKTMLRENHNEKKIYKVGQEANTITIHIRLKNG